MADSTLAAIRTKIRRLTKSPSANQISDVDIDEYVNTFIQYDFPEQLRLFTFKTTLTFYTTPYVDVYDTNTIDVNSPLFNFRNEYTTVNPPAYIAGYKVFYSQSQEEFFNIYPFISSLVRVAVGDGVTTLFAGTLTGPPILQNKLIFTSSDANNEALVVRDIPQINPVTGETTVLGDLVTPDNLTVSVGTINYRTGVFSFTFPAAPAAGEDVDSQAVPTVIARPQAILFYDNQFTVRPVPDKAYEITLEAFRRPTQLLAAGNTPELEQWWQYIAYGGAKKVLEDRLDMETIQRIMPEFNTQQRLALRRTIVQQTDERTATIYTEQTADSYYNGFGPGGQF